MMTAILNTENVIPDLLVTSFATFDRAWYSPIQTGIVARVGKQPALKTELEHHNLSQGNMPRKSG